MGGQIDLRRHGGDGATVVVSSTASDSHMWNLVWLQLFLEERGHNVVNLGVCVPDELLIEECAAASPDLVVISSVNGHGVIDGLRAGPLLRADARLRDTKLVIGGKLGTDGIRGAAVTSNLAEAGFDAVFGDDDIDGFEAFLRALPARVPS